MKSVASESCTICSCCCNDCATESKKGRRLLGLSPAIVSDLYRVVSVFAKTLQEHTIKNKQTAIRRMNYIILFYRAKIPDYLSVCAKILQRSELIGAGRF
jgi:hypothetical protein